MQRVNTVDNNIGGETGYHDRERKLMASEQGYYDRIVQHDNLTRIDDRHHCELCDLKDRDIKQLTAEQQILSNAHREANLGRFTAAGILRTMALSVWRRRERELTKKPTPKRTRRKQRLNDQLINLATAFFAAKNGMDVNAANASAREHINLADMHVSNSLFGKTQTLGESWEASDG